MWQAEIEAKLCRNGSRLLTPRGVNAEQADATLAHVVTEMNSAFPDARLHPRSWRRFESSMTNHPKDHHRPGRSGSRQRNPPSNRQHQGLPAPQPAGWPDRSALRAVPPRAAISAT